MKKRKINYLTVLLVAFLIMCATPLFPEGWLRAIPAGVVLVGGVGLWRYDRRLEKKGGG